MVPFQDSPHSDGQCVPNGARAFLIIESYNTLIDELEIRRDLSLVCKIWNAIMEPILYSAICCSPNNHKSLINALLKRRSDYRGTVGTYTRSVLFYPTVALRRISPETVAIQQQIYAACPNLRSITNHWRCAPGSSTFLLPNNIQFFLWRCCLEDVHPTSLSLSESNLKSLSRSVRVLSLRLQLDHLQVIPQDLSFPNLEVLEVSTRDLPSRWHTPKLEHLHIYINTHSYFPTIPIYLEKLAPQLRILTLEAIIRNVPIPTEAISLCTNLEILVYTPLTFSGCQYQTKITLPRLHHVGLLIRESTTIYTTEKWIPHWNWLHDDALFSNVKQFVVSWLRENPEIEKKISDICGYDKRLVFRRQLPLYSLIDV